MNDIEKAIDRFQRIESLIGSKTGYISLAIQALQEQLDREKQPKGWISTEWEIPADIGLWVWIYPVNDKVVLAKYVGDGFYQVGRKAIYGTHFSHWMLADLPDPPKEGNI